jgi:hypothetical protein
MCRAKRAQTAVPGGSFWHTVAQNRLFAAGCAIGVSADGRRLLKPGPVQVHTFHPVVIIIGLLFALRRMSVSLRTLEQHPGVEGQAFERWKAQARNAYGLGMSACFGKVLLDYAIVYLFAHYPLPVMLLRVVGVGLEVTWLALVVVAYLRVRRAHALAREVGVEPRVVEKA